MLERLASPFRFTATSVAAAAIVIYTALFASVLVFDGLPRVPKNTRGLDLDRAYQALSVVRPAVLLFARLGALCPGTGCCTCIRPSSSSFESVPRKTVPLYLACY